MRERGGGIAAQLDHAFRQAARHLLRIAQVVVVAVCVQADEPMCAIPVAFQPQLLRQVAELVVTLDMQQVGGLEIGVLLDPVAEIVPRGHGRQAQAGIEVMPHG
ncbi:hypothetical protein G6F22_020468 [Rhizopus arrhizus]|nr:hypothetical protein G6F22_020468 [Rhizopus arrhizus]